MIVNRDAFKDKNLQKAAYTSNPLEDGSLDDYRIHALPLTTMVADTAPGAPTASWPRTALLACLPRRTPRPHVAADTVAAFTALGRKPVRCHRPRPRHQKLLRRRGRLVVTSNPN